MDPYIDPNLVNLGLRRTRPLGSVRSIPRSTWLLRNLGNGINSSTNAPVPSHWAVFCGSRPISMHSPALKQLFALQLLLLRPPSHRPSPNPPLAISGGVSGGSILFRSRYFWELVFLGRLGLAGSVKFFRRLTRRLKHGSKTITDQNQFIVLVKGRNLVGSYDVDGRAGAFGFDEKDRACTLNCVVSW